MGLCGRPSVNFNKLLPGDKVFISIEGIRKSAVVRVVDPFQELVTVECGNEEIIAPFRDVLPPPEPTPDTVKRRRPAALPQAAPAASPPPPVLAPVSVQSAIAPQFATIVRLDGIKISCGDLVSLTPNSADVVFIVLELYQDQLGEKWEVKLKQDDHYFYATFAEFALDLPLRSLLVNIKFAESTSSFRQHSYRQDTAADCC